MQRPRRARQEREQASGAGGRTPSPPVTAEAPHDAGASPREGSRVNSCRAEFQRTGPSAAGPSAVAPLRSQRLSGAAAEGKRRLERERAKCRGRREGAMLLKRTYEKALNDYDMSEQDPNARGIARTRMRPSPEGVAEARPGSWRLLETRALEYQLRWRCPFLKARKAAPGASKASPGSWRLLETRALEYQLRWRCPFLKARKAGMRRAPPQAPAPPRGGRSFSHLLVTVFISSWGFSSS